MKGDRLFHFEQPAPPRYPDCTFYQKCLTKAAFRNAMNLGCTRCSNYKPAPIDFADLGQYMPGCALLLWAVFVSADHAHLVSIDRVMETIIHGPRLWRSFDLPAESC